jgi:hypothetical protein
VRKRLFSMPERILWEQSSCCQKMMSMLLTLLSTCLAFFGLAKFVLPMHGSCFLPRSLV